MMKPPKWMGCLLVLLVTCGCSPGGPGLAELASPTPATGLGVEIVNHSRPDLAVDLEPFRSAGCVPGDSGRWTCTESSPVAAFTCDQLREPSPLLGGLDGAVPLLQCEITPRRNEQGLDPATVEARIEEGTFEVHLFRYRLCGCGPHTTFAADYLVSEEGEVTRREVIPQYEDPAQDDLCVD